jgi:hypothetical protein
MLAKIKKVKLNTEGKSPVYKVILECPQGKQLYIHFDYSFTTRIIPLEVIYDGKRKGVK